MTRAANRRDRGSTLVMVLVLIVVAGLLIVPTLGYAVTVLRYNEVLSANTANAEAAKAGLRIALGDPRSVYDSCTSTTPVPLAIAPLDIPTTTTCRLLDEVTRYQPAELPWAVTTTWFGVAPPPDGLLEGQSFDVSQWSSYTDWQNFTTADRIATPTAPGYETERSIWLPMLATRPVTERTGGFAMPSGEFNANFASCTVYFPGTYRDPVTVDGPTYFTSGVYYFESTLTIGGGASVVMGSGQHEGCTDDQRAAFSAIGVPSTHNITGVGATVIVGAAGRIDIDDRGVGPVEFRMNTRYVAPDDTALQPSEEVSIVTVNGAADAGGGAAPLDIAGGLSVPASTVGGANPYPASDDGYQPSSLVPVPAIPNPPTGVAVTPFDGALTVSWQTSTGESLAALTSYVATATSETDPNISVSCDAPRFRTSCTLVGLTNEATYRVSVVANSTSGASRPSAVVTASPTSTDPPGVPPDAATIVGQLQIFDDAIRVEFAPPANDGGAPVNLYTVEVPAVYDATATEIFAGGTCTSDGEFNECAIALGSTDADTLATSADLMARVNAATAFGEQWSTPVAMTSIRRTGESYVAPTTETAPAPQQTEAVLGIATSGNHAVTVDIPGYVAIPQGRLAVERGAGSAGTLRIDGALLASWIALDGCEPSVCIIGQTNEPTQRVIQIQTEVDPIEGAGAGTTRSDAVVQINANGAWAVNSWVVQRQFGAA